MKNVSQYVAWSFFLSILAITGLTAYLMEFGYEHADPVNWRYYPNQCSLRCARQGCIHRVYWPTLYHSLVKPQVSLLKQTGAYQMANLVVYFGVLPLLYVGWLVWTMRRFIRKIPLGFTLIGLLTTLPLVWIGMKPVCSPAGRDIAYWGATNWCVLQANRFQMSLSDIYTLLFGILIPASVLVIGAHFLISGIRANGR